MNSKHTPGPWHVATGDEWDGATVYSGKSWPVNARVVATCEGSDIPGSGGECRTDEAKANAVLVSAAPELLEALEMLLSRVISDQEALNSDYGPSGREIIEQARAAIRKAKGEA